MTTICMAIMESEEMNFQPMEQLGSPSREHSPSSDGHKKKHSRKRKKKVSNSSFVNLRDWTSKVQKRYEKKLKISEQGINLQTNVSLPNGEPDSNYVSSSYSSSFKSRSSLGNNINFSSDESNYDSDIEQRICRFLKLESSDTVRKRKKKKKENAHEGTAVDGISNGGVGVDLYPGEPTDVVGDVVGDVSADVSADVIADAPVDVTADAPADVTADAPAGVLVDVGGNSRSMNDGTLNMLEGATDLGGTMLDEDHSIDPVSKHTQKEKRESDDVHAGQKGSAHMNDQQVSSNTVKKKKDQPDHPEESKKNRNSNDKMVNADNANISFKENSVPNGDEKRENGHQREDPSPRSNTKGEAVNVERSLKGKHGVTAEEANREVIVEDNSPVGERGTTPAHVRKEANGEERQQQGEERQQQGEERQQQGEEEEHGEEDAKEEKDEKARKEPPKESISKPAREPPNEATRKPAREPPKEKDSRGGPESKRERQSKEETKQNREKGNRIKKKKRERDKRVPYECHRSAHLRTANSNRYTFVTSRRNAHRGKQKRSNRATERRIHTDLELIGKKNHSNERENPNRGNLDKNGSDNYHKRNAKEKEANRSKKSISPSREGQANERDKPNSRDKENPLAQIHKDSNSNQRSAKHYEEKKKENSHPGGRKSIQNGETPRVDRERDSRNKEEGEKLERRDRQGEAEREGDRNGRGSEKETETERQSEKGKEIETGRQSEKGKEIETGRQKGIGIEKQSEKGKESEIGKQNEIEIGRQNEIEIGKQNESEIEKQNEIEIGKQSEIGIEKQNEIEIGRQSEIEIGKQNEIEIGRQNEIGTERSILKTEKTRRECPRVTTHHTIF
ncbi:hypothetical protein PCYB_032790 [Plasmodium cynomolgi strain B]|uniref:Uncharacterized protein n=1 Tax=Plasmodium cynomolgi (strain B) TaxID=1120755 RepID=K6UIB4_PLACD|nr:hypothetical protein PCYB_032790 [Plasmodium cynomolgi strain B]GAB64868.1 hypothetical protein PCYB_032790 [Plasmodium cynomolgi strain B]